MWACAEPSVAKLHCYTEPLPQTHMSHCLLQLTVLDPVEVLQLCPERRCKWISYSAYDAKATWQLSQALKAKLEVQSTQSVALCF